MQEYIDSVVHAIRAVYHCSEEEVLWRDWNWVDDTMERIIKDKLHERRWGLMSAAAANAIATHGSDGAKPYEDMVRLTYTPDELRAMDEAEEAEAYAQLEEARAERNAMMRSAMGVGNEGDTEQGTGGVVLGAY